MKWWCNFWSVEDMTIWCVFKIFFRIHTFWWNNFLDHKNSSHGKLRSLIKVNVWECAFWQFSKKLVDDKKYLIVTLHKSFGERFDHFHQSENILQSYSHHQKNIFKMKFRSYFYLGFMEFFGILLSKKIIKMCCSMC